MFFLLIALTTAFAADLFHDDFSHFPPGRLSGPIGELNGAIQEYHYLPHRGVPLGPWANPMGELSACRPSASLSRSCHAVLETKWSTVG